MRILVSVASKHHATAEIAHAVTEELRAAGHDVVTADPEAVSSLDGIDALVLGSGVYAGHWLKPARELAARFENELAGRPVWLFSSGPLGDPPKPDPDGIDVAEIVRRTGAREHQVFSGRLDRSALGFAERTVARAVKAPEGDFRDWDAVRAWARQIADDLASVDPRQRSASAGGSGPAGR